MSIEFDHGKAYTVDRGAPKARNGQGMLAGMGVVLKHFRDAMTKKLDSPSETSGIFTVQYPEEHSKLPEASRNFPILLYEDATGQELCTSCFQCERICPPRVIHITQAKDPISGKAVPAIAEFAIEYDACMSCGLCAEVCPFDAIKMDHEFELSTDVHGGLTIDRAGLMRPISYYEQLAPSFWAEVKDGALKKLQGATKRRSGLIGIAPQVAETLKGQKPELSAPRTTGQELSAALATTAEAAPTVSAGPEPISAVVPPVTSAPSSDLKAEKAAKLAAIRAANAKKDATPELGPSAEVAQSSSAPTGVEATPMVASTDPKTEKAAKLAAIRAANAQKKQNPEGTP